MTSSTKLNEAFTDPEFAHSRLSSHSAFAKAFGTDIFAYYNSVSASARLYHRHSHGCLGGRQSARGSMWSSHSVILWSMLNPEWIAFQQSYARFSWCDWSGPGFRWQEIHLFIASVLIQAFSLSVDGKIPSWCKGLRSWRRERPRSIGDSASSPFDSRRTSGFACRHWQCKKGYIFLVILQWILTPMHSVLGDGNARRYRRRASRNQNHRLF